MKPPGKLLEEPREVALVMETTLTMSRNMLRGIRRYMSEHQNWSVILETGLRAPLWLSDWSGDGIISRSWGQEMVDLISATQLPTVEVRHSKAKHQLPFVGVDNHALGTMVARHFMERGFRYFASFAIDVESFVEDRAKAFEETLLAEGLRCENYRQSERDPNRGPSLTDQEALIDWLNGLPKPCGIMACTDRFGVTLLDACRKGGIGVPEEIAVVGVGDDESLCEMASTLMSSVHFPAAKIGYEAASLLDRLMAGAPPPKELLLLPPIGVTTRRSSDIVAVEDREVAKALRFIREHASQGICVDDVCSTAGVSRRTLERRMRRIIGRSPQEELVRVKLALARQLLAETDLSLEEVSFRAGFSCVQYLSELFRKNFDTTPGRHRKAMRVPEPV